MLYSIQGTFCYRELVQIRLLYQLPGLNSVFLRIYIARWDRFMRPWSYKSIDNTEHILYSVSPYSSRSAMKKYSTLIIAAALIAILNDYAVSGQKINKAVKIQNRIAVVKSKYDDVDLVLKNYHIPHDVLAYRDLENPELVCRYRSLLSPAGSTIPWRKALTSMPTISDSSPWRLSLIFTKLTRTKSPGHCGVLLNAAALRIFQAILLNICRGPSASLNFLTTSRIWACRRGWRRLFSTIFRAST